jgi:hypothetical protein
MNSRVHENATGGSFFAHENVHAFLKACSHLGVPPFSLFDSSALTGVTKDTRAVVHTLLRLAKAAMALGFEPPYVSFALMLASCDVIMAVLCHYVTLHIIVKLSKWRRKLMH